MFIRDADGVVASFDVVTHPFLPDTSSPFADYTSFGCQAVETAVIDAIVAEPGAFTFEVNSATDTPAVAGAIFDPQVGPPPAEGPLELTGEIDGAPYRIVAPANQEDWNGVLLAYAHGYVDALDHPSEGTDRGRVDAAPGGAEAEAALIAQGFALAGSQYKTDGWAVEDGIVDTEALITYFGENLAEPDATVLWGFSMGSVVAGHAAENSDSVDGVIAACFVGAGAPAPSTAAWHCSSPTTPPLACPQPGETRATCAMTSTSTPRFSRSWAHSSSPTHSIRAPDSSPRMSDCSPSSK